LEKALADLKVTTEERMLLMQWAGAIAILLAGLIEVLFGHKKITEPVHSMYT